MKIVNWVKDRIKERTSWDGGALIAVGVIGLFFSAIIPLNLICWAAIIWGVITLTKSDGMGAVMLVFGSIGLYSVYQDFNNYKGEAARRNYRLLTHIGRMVGGFTATVTAVLVVNAQYIPLYIPAAIYWLAPTLIFTPLSIYWIRQRKK